jgi:DNA gyrase subunit A
VSSQSQLTLPIAGAAGRRGEKSKPSGDGGRGGGGRKGKEPPPPPPPSYEDASLVEEAQRRYLNYAVSVITSRALPDVRDGLKPVQRRILYTMHNELRLGPDSKPRKSAAVVGDVMGKFHPHGDSSIYEAMVRLAQDFAMRVPLVVGQGNYGSLDGDDAAAMRYTEAKLAGIATELLSELGQRTVDWRPNYDGTRSEPVVLPARFPHLLVNGSQGIAVGMATNIPPHNLGEVIDAAIALIDQEDLPVQRLLKFVKGPDFPTGGQLLASRSELEAVYTSGHGTLRLRGEWQSEEEGRGNPQVVITSIPYGIERRVIVEKIAEVIIQKKLPTLHDVRDESTQIVRVVLEIKKGTDPQLVMAYLFKNTPLSTTVSFNMTCLVPAPEKVAGMVAEMDGAPTVPRRLGLREMLVHFLEFRMSTLKRRLEFQLGEVRARIHILEGLEIVFDALDEIIKIIRASDGRADAQAKLMKRFALSEEQTDAILDLRLYRLAKLEILVVRKELEEKRKEAKRLDTLLKSDAKRKSLLSDELTAIKAQYADKRRTKILGSSDEPEFQAEDFIVAEDANVILSAQGWVKRVKEIKDLSATRVREGDAVLGAVAGSTRSSIAFMSSLGACYVSRVHDVPPSTGYGDPVQKFFKMDDGERMIALFGFDPRALEVPEPTEGSEPEAPYAVAVTALGLAFRFSLRAHREPSTRAGRKFGKLQPGDEIIAVMLQESEEQCVLVAATDGHVLGVELSELPLLSGAGKGSKLIDLKDGERVVAATLTSRGHSTLEVENEKGKAVSITLGEARGSRAGKGNRKRDRFVRAVPQPPEPPAPLGPPLSTRDVN